MRVPQQPTPVPTPSKPLDLSSPLTESLARQRHQSLMRRVSLIHSMALVVMIMAIVTSIFWWAMAIPGGLIPGPTVYAAMFVGVVNLCAYLLTSANARVFRANLASGLISASLLLVVFLLLCFNLGTLQREVLRGVCLLVPLLATLCGMAMREIVITIVLSYMAMVSGTYFGDLAAATPRPETQSLFFFINWGLVFTVAGLSLVVFSRQLNRATTDLEKQSEELTRLFLSLSATTEFGAGLSRELSGVTAELSATSHQHASNTQEQVAAITEVTTSLEELNETANQIAHSASLAAAAATRSVEFASVVKGASETARETASNGTEAVEQAIGSVERVRNRIELLGQRLLNLTEQTRRVGGIIDLIDAISDETHLLALNASIEAAGTTGPATSSGGVSVRNERFGVIAQEVKNLSDRSRESTEEVRQAIAEMQGAVAAAVLVAEEGKKETFAALSRSQIAGAVIEKLNDVIAESADQADNITNTVEEVKIRSDEISVATRQQRSANQQILFTMQAVSQISRESAGAVSQLSETVVRVNNQIEELNQVLDHAGAAGGQLALAA